MIIKMVYLLYITKRKSLYLWTNKVYAYVLT
jgi:hypothetical protein